ncbi:hypothetical protein [Acinetobacter guillouiae]|uniref:hypothetical protein n=1 Tax=Acinetobacter guillouiae TaxID=106649 RepID=UPI001AE30836|nr:hypothetical protein [Acinetobacter guillouiae]MBP2542852.1 hypothetical protein [Acinetobacter guillouiae]
MKKIFFKIVLIFITTTTYAETEKQIACSKFRDIAYYFVHLQQNGKSKAEQIAFVDTYGEKTGDETEYLKIMLNYIYENIEIEADTKKQESIANYFGDLSYVQCIEKT